MVRYLAPTVYFALGACGRFGFRDAPATDALADASDWWDSAYAFRNQVVIRSSLVSERLDRFPLALRLRAPAVDRSALQADLRDLRFVTLDGTTVPYDVELVTGDSITVWIQRPALDPAGDETLWVYYGNPAALADTRGAEVWSEEFLGVWHLTDDRDATIHGAHGTYRATTAVAGPMGSARDFGGGWFEVPPAPHLLSIGGGRAGSWSVWINPTTRSSFVDTAIGRESANSSNDFRIGTTPGGTLEAEMETDDLVQANVQFDGGLVPLGQWSLVALVRDDTAIRTVMNGVTVTTSTAPGTMVQTNKRILLGADCNGCVGDPASDFLDGILDEARIESVPRSDAWFAAATLDGRDMLVELSLAESRP